MKRAFALISGVAILAACDNSAIGGPSRSPDESAGAIDEVPVSSAKWHEGYRLTAPISIYQQNVYVGTDVDAVITAGATSSDPAALFGALLGALSTFDATDWKARAGRMAEEIRNQGPDVISLNEISTVSRRGLGSYGVADNSTDFLPVFLAELSVRRLDYRVVGQVKNTDVIIPLSIDPSTGEIISGPDGLPAAFASLVDYDVLLVRRGIRTANVVTKNYQAYLPVNLGPLPVAIRRGYVAADVTVLGQEFRVVSTHPEPRSPVKEVQEAQVTELLHDLAATSLPVVVAGDLNSEPNDPAGSPWDQMTRAGFTDLWTVRLGRPEPGATCCHSPDLRNSTSMLDRRMDYVWVRPDAGHRVGPVILTVFGDELNERTASGLWPSDHGGLFGGVGLLPKEVAYR